MALFGNYTDPFQVAKGLFRDYVAPYRITPYGGRQETSPAQSRLVFGRKAADQYIDELVEGGHLKSHRLYTPENRIFVIRT